MPMGPDRRIWGPLDFLYYWLITNVTLSAWSSASSLLSLGLNVGETMGIIVVGNIFIALLALLNAAPGGYYHIGYTVLLRVAFGIYGSYVGVVVRIVLSIVWYGSLSYLGSQCLNCVLSLWSPKYMHMANTLPNSAALTTKDLVGFLLFQILLLPLLTIKPEKISRFMVAASLVTLVTFVSITCWAVVANGGNGPLMKSYTPMLSYEKSWAWIYGLSSWYGSLLSGVANQSDFTRFSKSPWVSLWGTCVALMVVGTCVPLMGIVSALALKSHYGAELWTPHSILQAWLEHSYSPGARAAATFAGIFLVFSQIVFNTLANGFAGGMDLAGILPSVFDIRRGAILTALLSWAVQPWRFYNTSLTFVVVILSFSVFMLPLVGIIVSDFWVINRKQVKLSHLYTADTSGVYWYQHGFNLRALFVWLLCFAPGLPGLVEGADPKVSISEGAKRFYQGSAIFEFFMAFTLNLILARVFDTNNIAADSADYFNSYTDDECARLGLTPYSKLPLDQRMNIGSELQLENEGGGA